MPTYEYQCDACDHNFEEFQSMSEEPLKTCPQCKKRKLRRVFGAGAAVLFKGSGFYQTDYRSESYKSAAKAEQDAAKPAAADAPSANGKADAVNGATSTSGAKAKGKTSKSKARVSDE
jgi:putative FmdB family regulatory protein